MGKSSGKGLSACACFFAAQVAIDICATFHAQQCAEKCAKALFTLRQIAFPRTHDLAALYALCQQNGIILPVSEDNLEKLSAFGVEVRYPGMRPTFDEAKEALQIAKSVRRFARKFLGL